MYISAQHSFVKAFLNFLNLFFDLITSQCCVYAQKQTNITWLELGKQTFFFKYQFLSPQTQLEIFRLPFKISSVSHAYRC